MVKGTHHTGITVVDLKETLRFYVDTLGLELVSLRESVTADHVRKIVGFPDAVISIAMLRTPDGSGLELLQYHEPRGRRILVEPCDMGSTHIAFAVSDLRAVWRQLASQGVSFRSEPQISPIGPTKGSMFVYGSDPNGAVIELVQPA